MVWNVLLFQKVSKWLQAFDQLMMKVIIIHPKMNICPKFCANHLESVSFPRKLLRHNCEPSRFILWKPWMSVQMFEPIHPLDVKIFWSGLKCWTERLLVPSLKHAAGMVHNRVSNSQLVTASINQWDKRAKTYSAADVTKTTAVGLCKHTDWWFLTA